MSADGSSNISVSKDFGGGRLIVEDQNLRTMAEVDTLAGDVVVYVGGDYKLGMCFAADFLNSLVDVLARTRDELSKETE